MFTEFRETALIIIILSAVLNRIRVSPRDKWIENPYTTTSHGVYAQ